MSSGPTLITTYSEALAHYEKLYRDGKIKDWQLALIKQQTDLNSVLSTVREAEAKNEGERNTIDRLFHRVSPHIVTKIERFSGVVDTAIQSSVLFPFPYRYWIDCHIMCVLMGMLEPEVSALVWSSIKFILIVLLPECGI